MIARDQMKNEGIEDLHSKEQGRNVTRILLERYDMVSHDNISHIAIPVEW